MRRPAVTSQAQRRAASLLAALTGALLLVAWKCADKPGFQAFLFSANRPGSSSVARSFPLAAPSHELTSGSSRGEAVAMHWRRMRYEPVLDYISHEDRERIRLQRVVRRRRKEAG